MSLRTPLAVAGVLALVMAPFVLPVFYVGLLTKVMIYGIFAMSYDLLLGYAGLASFGHAVFFGSGAYALGLVSVKAGLPLWIATLVGFVAPVVLALVLAPFSLRARGIQFSMVTLALGQVVWGLAYGWRSLTAGDDGLPGIPRPLPLAAETMPAEVQIYYLVAASFGICVYLLHRLVRSPFGCALVGTRSNEVRMATLGYNVWRHRFVAILLAAFIAGIAGVLFGFENGLVSPGYLSITMSAQVLLMVALGGAGTLFGAVLGAAMMVLLEHFVSSVTERWTLVLGIIYIGVALFAPKGLIALVRRTRAPQ